MKTLALRVRFQNDSALRVATLPRRPRPVKRVNYPGLASHPQHARARELFAGFGGMLSFELHAGLSGAEDVRRARAHPRDRAEPRRACTPLLTRPATTSHAGLTREERLQRGITDGLLRLSVGIEATEDLLEDFEQALR